MQITTVRDMGAVVRSGYGPTECVIIINDENEIMPDNITCVGAPIFNARVCLRRELGCLLQKGVLCVSGVAQLARGYIGDPENTHRAFGPFRPDANTAERW